MYASVEMLLKFYAEKYSFSREAFHLRKKCGSAHVRHFCK